MAKRKREEARAQETETERDRYRTFGQRREGSHFFAKKAVIFADESDRGAGFGLRGDVWKQGSIRDGNEGAKKADEAGGPWKTCLSVSGRDDAGKGRR